MAEFENDLRRQLRTRDDVRARLEADDAAARRVGRTGPRPGRRSVRLRT